MLVGALPLARTDAIDERIGRRGIEPVTSSGAEDGATDRIGRSACRFPILLHRRAESGRRILDLSCSGALVGWYL